MNSKELKTAIFQLVSYPHDVLFYLIILNNKSSFGIKHSIFDYLEKKGKYYVEDRAKLDSIIEIFKNSLSTDFFYLESDLTAFEEANKENPLHIASIAQSLYSSIKYILKYNDIRDIYDIYELEWHVEGLLEYKDFFEDNPTFLILVFRAYQDKLKSFKKRFKQIYKPYLELEIPSEFMNNISEEEQSIINEIENVIIESTTSLVVLLNEFGVLDGIKSKYPKISNQQLAKVLTKICNLEHSNTIKRNLDSLENPPTSMSSKNNPYLNPKNLDKFNKFIETIGLEQED